MSEPRVEPIASDLRRVLVGALGICGTAWAIVHLSPWSMTEVGQRAFCAVFAALGSVLALAWVRSAVRWQQGVLLVMTTLACASTFRLDAERFRHVDYHDVTCYYLGAKYSAEIGPFDLYPTVALVDRENRRYVDLTKTYWAQDRDGFRRKSLKHALNRGRKVRATKFTPERWKQYERDVLVFQKGLGSGGTRGFLRDKGFNATPPWITYVKPLVDLVPAEQVRWLTLLDPVLMAAALLLVALTFGWEAGAWSLFYFCVTVSTKWLILGSIILRYDWVACLLLALCLIERRSYKWAGFLTALAALFRYFPLVWAYGIVGRSVAAWGRPPGSAEGTKRPVLGFLLVLVATLVALGVTSVAVVGVERSQDQIIKMGHHTSPEMVSSKRPGMLVLLGYDGAVERTRYNDGDRARMRMMRPVQWGLAAVALGALAWGLRRKDDVESYALGYIPFFLLAMGTYYYHIARITLVVLHAGRLQQLRHRVSLAFLLLLEVYSQLIFVFIPDHQLVWTGVLSWGLAIYVFCTIGWLLWDGREGGRQRLPH